MDRTQRVAVFVGLLIVLGGIAWTLVPFEVGERSCSAPAVEAARHRTVSVQVPSTEWGEPNTARQVASPCAKARQAPRLATGGIIAGAGVIAPPSSVPCCFAIRARRDVRPEREPPRPRSGSSPMACRVPHLRGFDANSVEG